MYSFPSKTRCKDHRSCHEKDCCLNTNEPSRHLAGMNLCGGKVKQAMLAKSALFGNTFFGTLPILPRLCTCLFSATGAAGTGIGRRAETCWNLVLGRPIVRMSTDVFWAALLRLTVTRPGRHVPVARFACRLNESRILPVVF